jgi:predicted ATPase
LADSIGTAKALLLVNYRPEYSHQWNSKTYYTQLRLDPLGKESAEAMLSALLGDGKDLIPLKRLIIEKTEGNPFFMEETVQVLLDEGALARNGTVKLTKSLSELRIPSMVQAILAARIDRLPPDEKDLLQTLAVLGKEFTLSQVKATVVARSESELERMLADLQIAEFIYEQPALADIEYTFKHALTQEVAYSSVLIARRKLLHARTAEALETLFRDRLADRFSELAYHYSRSGNSRKAVEYLRLAAKQASQRAAYSEAFISASRGLELLNTLSNEPECIRHNIGLQTTLAEALIMLEGFSASAISALERAKQLCEQPGNSAQLFSVLQTLRVVYLSLDLQKARQIAEQALVLAEREKEPALLAVAYTVGLGQVLLYLGEFAAARNCFERGLANTDSQLRQSGDSGSAPRGVALSLSASVLWFLGYPNQALERIQDALAMSRLSSSPYERLTTSAYAGNVHQCLRNGQTLLTQTEAILPLAPEQGLPILIARIMMQHGWALADQGRLAEGIAEMERAVEAQKSAGGPAFSSHYCWLAEAYLKDGRFRDGLGSIAEAFDMIKERGDRNYEAELHRLKGELLLRQDHSNAAEAQNCFERAIEIARNQSAKSWELRATASLARLLAKQGKRAEARAMLAEIYGWFTEGFDTTDLKDAKALLDELRK